MKLSATEQMSLRAADDLGRAVGQNLQPNLPHNVHEGQQVGQTVAVEKFDVGGIDTDLAEGRINGQPA